MNYPKWIMYSLIVAVFFYVFLEFNSAGTNVMAAGFFSSTGFITVFFFVLAEMVFAAYSWGFANGNKAKSASKSKLGEKNVA